MEADHIRRLIKCQKEKLYLEVGYKTFAEFLEKALDKPMSLKDFTEEKQWFDEYGHKFRFDNFQITERLK